MTMAQARRSQGMAIVVVGILIAGLGPSPFVVAARRTSRKAHRHTTGGSIRPRGPTPPPTAGGPMPPPTASSVPAAPPTDGVPAATHSTGDPVLTPGSEGVIPPPTAGGPLPPDTPAAPSRITKEVSLPRHQDSAPDAPPPPPLSRGDSSDNSKGENGGQRDGGGRVLRSGTSGTKVLPFSGAASSERSEGGKAWDDGGAWGINGHEGWRDDDHVEWRRELSRGEKAGIAMGVMAGLGALVLVRMMALNLRRRESSTREHVY